MLLLSIAAQLAFAGYGDPVDGVPNAWERELHLWTNAVRVEPEAFADLYPCDYDSFTANEQTPKIPLLWEDGLGEAARFHTDDMVEADHFSHTSSDGTPFDVRMARFYEGGFIGENIAMGYPDPWTTVIEGWMCSSGHRANIMTDFEELGTGVRGTWYTQDFGSRGIALGENALRLGVHNPVDPDGSVTLLAAFYDESGAPPARIEAIVNGDPHGMTRLYGTRDAGIFEVEIDPRDDCVVYFFESERADGTIDLYPEEGVYGFGDCDWVDADAQWMYRDEDGLGYSEAGPEGSDDEDPPHRRWRKWPFGGCTTAPTPTGGWLLLAIPLLLRRRA